MTISNGENCKNNKQVVVVFFYNSTMEFVYQTCQY